jgi:hypothetical protein
MVVALGDRIWVVVRLVKLKYVKNKCISLVNHKNSDSAIWYDLLKIDNFILEGGSIRLKMGSQSGFGKALGLITLHYVPKTCLTCA